MKLIIIISNNNDYAESLAKYLEFKYKISCKIINIPEIKLFLDKKLDSYFNYISSELSLIEYNSDDTLILKNSICILDLPFNSYRLIDYDPLYKREHINQLFTMLSFAYPEIAWVIPVFNVQDENNPYFVKWIKLLDKIEELINEETVLYDPFGFRQSLRNAINDNQIWHKIYNIVIRDKLAAAIDEEKEYAYLHGYIAYKLGYRCFIVSSMRLFEKLFSNRKEDQNRNWPLNIELTFEDMFLNYPDKENNEINLSNLQTRDEKFKKLTEVKNRIFVTVGHKYIKWSEANKLYIKELKAKARAKGGIVRKIYKPSGGIYNTMEQAGLLKDYWKKRKDEWQKAKPGPNTEEAGGHSAPGRLLLIAEKLIERARKILDEANTVQDCIHGALLALEAQELLGYKTPTTCLEAIALKHQLEVKAECMFYGVGYNIDMKNRFKEIEGEVKAVSEWFHPSVRKKSYLNAQLGIITELVEILRDYGQFDEELQCLKKIRKLNRQFYFLNHPGLKFVQPLRAYIDTLVGSFPLFCGALFFWPIFYGLLGYLFNTRYEGYKDGILTFWEQVANSSYTFFGLQPSSQPIDTISHVLTIFTVLTGFLHLGIFISYLYNLIFRK